MYAPRLNSMPLMPGRADWTINPMQEQFSAAKKQKLLPLAMSGVTFHGDKNSLINNENEFMSSLYVL